MLPGDADLCLSDLPVIPIQVSLRDVVVMAFMNWMAVTYACPNPTIFSMQGPPGALSSAEHPILGTIIHFTAQRVSGNYGVTLNGKINAGWMHRLVADCRVAGRDFSLFERNHIESAEGHWMKKLIQKAEPTQSWGYPPPASARATYAPLSNPFSPAPKPFAPAPASNPFAPQPADPGVPEYPNAFLPLRRVTEENGREWQSKPYCIGRFCGLFRARSRQAYGKPGAKEYRH